MEFERLKCEGIAALAIKINRHRRLAGIMYNGLSNWVAFVEVAGKTAHRTKLKKS